MKRQNLYIALILTFLLTACQVQKKLYQLHGMGEFNLVAGNEFVRRIQYLPALNEISIVNTKADGNDFIVNNQSIFLDTAEQNFPNHYSYQKRATELNIQKDSLRDCLRAFYRIGVNEFNKDLNYYRFEVVVGLTTHRGYIYSEISNLTTGDTLPATSVRNLDYHFNVVLAKQIGKYWFEYYETR